jgi:peptide deformylase
VAVLGIDRPGTVTEVTDVDSRPDLGRGTGGDSGDRVDAELGAPEPVLARLRPPGRLGYPGRLGHLITRSSGRPTAAFEARRTQHQLDHLDSVLFLDRVPGAWTIHRLEQGVV